MAHQDDPPAFPSSASGRADAGENARHPPAQLLPGPTWLPLATAAAVLISGLNALVQVLRLLAATVVPHG